MNIPLFKQMMKVNMKSVMNYAFGSAFYILLMFGLYPSIAQNSDSINDLLQSMPEGMGRVFGVEGGLGNIESFISGEYYGLILILILSIFCVLLSTKLIAKLVDQGSMAYLLSTPTTRGKVAITQAIVLVTGLFLIMAVTTISGFVGYAWFIKDGSGFDPSRFIELNLAAFLLFFAVSGISFLVSSISNDEKRALGTSGAITFIFFSLDLLGKLSDKIAWMRNLSIFSLYRPSEIAIGDGNLVRASFILLVIGLVSFGIGIQVFRKRDLPL
ncbi:ABC transporter permease subunit [Paenibacillus sediminis]|uniref:ABC-2 type transport system permease protein n=1 Tax=Paenibacillus sediminis TaxID=664909 RepID=A0ABS4H3C2_9BACL|nr:ABC transporter permease subunit [Paenibacillus sediminis]MBP1937029.1 ABC-2 type transport system permease protein [Paenibacillus sediminis]